MRSAYHLTFGFPGADAAQAAARAWRAASDPRTSERRGLALARLLAALTPAAASLEVRHRERRVQASFRAGVVVAGKA